jgi:hypothetical protein
MRMSTSRVKAAAPTNPAAARAATHFFVSDIRVFLPTGVSALVVMRGFGQIDTLQRSP